MFETAVEEKEAAEAEKRKARQEREETMRALIDEFRLQDAAVREKRKQEEKILKDWEMMQRFKRDEYNKQADLDEREQQWQQKLKYGDELRKLAVRFFVYTRARMIYNREAGLFFKYTFYYHIAGGKTNGEEARGKRSRG